MGKEERAASGTGRVHSPFSPSTDAWKKASGISADTARIKAEFSIRFSFHHPYITGVRQPRLIWRLSFLQQLRSIAGSHHAIIAVLRNLNNLTSI